MLSKPELRISSTIKSYKNFRGESLLSAVAPRMTNLVVLDLGYVLSA